MKELMVYLTLLLAVFSVSAQAMIPNILLINGWSGTPTIATIADPNKDATTSEGATIGEGLVDPRVCLAQTFKVPTTQTQLTLDKIEIWQNGGPPTANPYILRLVDLGTTDPTYQGGGSQTYAAGTDTWGGCLTFVYWGCYDPFPMEFDFQGAEEVMLTAGNYYAFEITAPTPIGGIWWYRANAAGSTYVDGAAFVDTTKTTPGIRDQLYKNSNGRDLAMAVYLVPEPATIALLSLGGLVLLRKRRATNKLIIKNGKGKFLMKRSIVCVVIVIALSMPVYATTIIGDWEQSPDGWIDWIEYGNNQSVADPLNMPSRYEYEPTIGVTLNDWSLHVKQSGWNQNLSIRLQNAGHVADFMADTIFAIDVTVPADSFGTGGWCEIYALSLNASYYGWNDQLPVPAYHWDYWTGSPQRMVTLMWDYSAAKEKIPANPSYVELIFATNSDGIHNDFYFDNARLVSTPEPATIAILGFGLILLRKRSR